jgi:hypothetical protein
VEVPLRLVGDGAVRLLDPRFQSLDVRQTRRRENLRPGFGEEPRTLAQGRKTRYCAWTMSRENVKVVEANFLVELLDR